MKLFVLAPKEDWICDRLVSEWYNAFPDICTKDINEADIIWLLAGWCWNHLPVEILKNKKIIVTEHHIVPEKFTQQKYHNFLARDQFVDCYHVPNEKTKSILKQLTDKRIEIISYWCNDNFWYPVNRREARKKLGLNNESYYVGSFQRDTEGSDLKTPKLEKGPDLFCDYLIKNKKKMEVTNELHVLLGGWRRQYVEKRLKEANINYTLFEKTNLDTIKLLYAACDLYIVSSRFEGGPQAIIEAAAMRVPIISTNVGIANTVLSKNCIINIEKNYYTPDNSDLDYALNRVKNLSIEKHGQKFISLFEEIK
jgi:glycosyltransferase involved in cell wall biosynthesis